MNALKLYPLMGSVVKTIKMPGSKSYTNRALLMAALTYGPVKIINPLFSDDTKAMIDSLIKLGIDIIVSENTIKVNGSIKDIRNKNFEINTELAATVLRFILPLLCIVPGIKIIKGKHGLNKRPIAPLVDALRDLGATIDYVNKEGYPPLRIHSSMLNTGILDMDGGVSSQFFSSLLMIAPVIGGITIRVKGKQISRPYIDMTINLMKKFGIDVINNNYTEYSVDPGKIYKVNEYVVEGDFSSAGYFFAIAALTRSTITVTNLNPNSAQADKKILSVLADMGNKITAGENMITIEGKGIKPIAINMLDFPDQAQTLAVLATFTKGKTVLTGLQSLHIKETDRIRAVVDNLKRMGIKTEETFDTLVIYGGIPVPAVIDTYGDQRTAMSFAVAGSLLSGMIIKEPDVVNKTFPGFWDKLEEIGIKIEVIK